MKDQKEQQRNDTDIFDSEECHSAGYTVPK